MPFAIVIIGIIIAVAAFNDSFASLASELEADLPGYFVWAIAIVAILGIGYVPGMKIPSRWLLGLVALVIVLKGWSQIQAGFTAFAQSGGTTTGSGAAGPTASYTAANAPGAATTSSGAPASSGGTTGAGNVTQLATAAQNLAANPLNPNSYVGLAAGFGGLA